MSIIVHDLINYNALMNNPIYYEDNGFVSISLNYIPKELKHRLTFLYSDIGIEYHIYILIYFLYMPLPSISKVAY